MVQLNKRHSDPVVSQESFVLHSSVQVIPPVRLSPVGSPLPVKDPALLIGLHPRQVVFVVSLAAVQRKVEVSD